MPEKTHWVAACRELVAAGRQKSGEFPSDEQLAAYFRGELAGREAARIQEILVYYPEIVRIFEEPFPDQDDAAGPGDPEPLSPEELAHDRAAIQARLSAAERPPVASAPDPPPLPAPVPFQARGKPLGVWQMSTAAAALLALTLGGLLFRAQQQVKSLEQDLRSPRIDVERRLLIPDGQRGESQPAIPLPSGAESFLLVPALTHQPEYPEYRLDILQATGDETKKVWSANGLRRGESGTFEILVPRVFLESGDRHRLEIHGVRAGKDDLLATYTVDLQGP